MSTETIRLIRDGDKGGKGVWREGGEGRIYTYRYTVTTTMTPALRWAAMRAIFQCFIIVRDIVKDSVHRPQRLKRKDSRSGFELRPLRLPA